MPIDSSRQKHITDMLDFERKMSELKRRGTRKVFNVIEYRADWLESQMTSLVKQDHPRTR